MASQAQPALEAKIEQSKARGKKPLPADMDDIDNLLTLLRTEMQQRKAATDELKDAANKTRQTLEATQSWAEGADVEARKAAEVSRAANDHATALREVFERQFGGLRSTVQAQGDEQDRLREELHLLTTNEMATLSAKATRSMQVIDEEALSGIKQRLSTVQASVEERLQRLESSVAQAHNMAGSMHEKGMKVVLEEINRTEGDLTQHCKTLQSDLLRLQSELDTRHVAVDGTLHKLEAVSQISQRRLEEASESLKELQGSYATRIGSLEDSSRTLESSVREVANVSTRRIEWVLQDVCSRLRSELDPSAPIQLQRLHSGELREAESEAPTPSREGYSWFSPRFAAAGAQGLQLELRFLGDVAPDAQQQQHQMQPAANSAGDCVVSLHAPDGLFIAFKLYIGKEVVQLQQTFSVQQPSCASRRMGRMEDHVTADSDSVMIGLEILEAISEVAMEPKEASEGADGADASAGEGKLILKRYLNHRLMEQVKGQVDLMRSRLVRRIEWHLEQAASLQRCFPEGHPICSAPFVAAGLEGLQLVFYPSGYTGAKEGYCSLFLYCPAGTVLRCWLSAGSQRREARLSSDTRPGFFGRTNFCRFENTVSINEDTVVLVLEIDEAQQDVKEKLSHSPRAASVDGPRQASPAGRSEAGATRTDGSGDTKAMASVGSTIKLQRVVGKGTLEDVKLLPSIWTPRPQASIDEVLDGYHNLGEYKTSKRAASSRGRTPRSVGVPWKEGSVRSEATASPNTALSQKYIMYAS